MGPFQENGVTSQQHIIWSLRQEETDRGISFKGAVFRTYCSMGICYILRRFSFQLTVRR